VAGLGIGGIAVALAIQNILGDLFASLSIALDKPFVIGDFIIVDQLLGTVEHIGLKTTRIRSLSGEQIVFSNADLLNSRIRNYKRMYERRVVFSIGVTYQTPYEKLASIGTTLKEIIESQPDVRFDRAHFREYADSSLNYEVVYYVKSPDYNRYMDIQQAINLEIYRRFQDGGIEFAYPTRTLYLQDTLDDESKPKKHMN
jgi:small-conductance mechanosensitive channel